MIIPVIFEQNLKDIKQKIRLVENIVDIVQIDVADGKLVDGKTFNNIYELDFVQTPVNFDIHLMVTDPIKYIEIKIEKAVSFCTQIEAQKQTAPFLERSKTLGYKVGLSVCPNTPLDMLNPYLHLVDYVQFMTITPGGQGRSFNKAVLDNIKTFRKSNPTINIQVDGGVNKYNLASVLNVGVNNVVIGAAIFRNDDPKKALTELMKLETNLKK